MRKRLTLALGFALAIPGFALADPSGDKANARHQVLTQKAKQADARVERQLRLVQQRLKQEEARMTARLKQLNKMRASALKKNDTRALKRIEQLEVKAIKQYDARVSQIVGAASGTAESRGGQPAGQSRTNKRTRRVYARPKPSGNPPVMQAPGANKSAKHADRNASAKRQSTGRKHKRSRKRFRFWPF